MPSTGTKGGEGREDAIVEGCRANGVLFLEEQEATLKLSIVKK